MTIEWLAGFFDGEGYVGFDKRAGRLYPRLDISQKDKLILQAIGREFGGRTYGPYRAWGPHRGCHHVWVGKSAVLMARRLAEHCVVKRSQLELMLQALEQPPDSRETYKLGITALKNKGPIPEGV